LAPLITVIKGGLLQTDIRKILFDYYGSPGGRIFFKIKIWLNLVKFNISVSSDKWLLMYSTFYSIRSSSVGGHLHFIAFHLHQKANLWKNRNSSFEEVQGDLLL
jgi:hypothetical protein